MDQQLRHSGIWHPPSTIQHPNPKSHLCTQGRIESKHAHGPMLVLSGPVERRLIPMHQNFYTLSSAPQARFPTVKNCPCHEAYIGPELMGPNAAEAKTRVQATVALSAKTPHHRQRMGSLRRNPELSYFLRYFHLPGLIFSSQGAAFSTGSLGHGCAGAIDTSFSSYLPRF